MSIETLEEEGRWTQGEMQKINNFFLFESTTVHVHCDYMCIFNYLFISFSFMVLVTAANHFQRMHHNSSRVHNITYMTYGEYSCFFTTRYTCCTNYM